MAQKKKTKTEFNFFFSLNNWGRVWKFNKICCNYRPTAFVLCLRRLPAASLLKQKPLAWRSLAIIRHLLTLYLASRLSTAYEIFYEYLMVQYRHFNASYFNRRVIVHTEDSKLNCKTIQRDLCRIKVHASEVQNLRQIKSLIKGHSIHQIGTISLLTNTGRIGWAARLVDSMPFNLGFQFKCILNPRSMHFNPMKL